MNPEADPIRVITRSTEETEALGARLAALSRPGMVWGLFGELGAGKTALVRGFVRGLGSPRRVQSPTYSLVHQYTGGPCIVHHLDLYRLANGADIHEAGLDEYLVNPVGISLVEWIERWNPDAQDSIHHIRIRCLDENTREILHDNPRH